MHTISLVPPAGDRELSQARRDLPPGSGARISPTSSTHGSTHRSQRASCPVAADSLSQHTIFVSTPTLEPIPTIPDPYIPPELALYRGAQLPLRPHVKDRSDMYALGAVLWALGAHEPNLPRDLPQTPSIRGRARELAQEEWHYWEAVRTCRTVQEQRVGAGILLRSLQGVRLRDDEPVHRN